jgi:prophage antirepressor-like protein
MKPRNARPGYEVAVRQEPAVHAFPRTGQTIRIVTIDDEAWFVAADACRILEIGRPQDSVRYLDEDERGRCLLDTPSGLQQMLTVSEPGLYTLIMRSRKPDAKAFRRWVTHEVLPSIRRTGAYAVGTMTPREVAKLVADRADTAEIRAAELAPAAEAWGALAEATGDYSLREAALILTRDHGIETGQNRLMKALSTLGMVDDRGRPYARHNAHLVARPVTWTHPSGEPRLSYQIRVTVVGLEYLRKRLGQE